MLDALVVAIASADLQDWTTVLEELQQLPWSARKEGASGMSGSEWQMA
jgi:hypothetical protein